jgi:hypothetical protein
MKPATSPSPIPRALGVFLPPVLALLLAVLYQQWQASRARESAETLCAQFNAGAAVTDFVVAARAADFDIEGAQPRSLLVIAHKDIYRLAHESYRCRARHDGTHILSTEADMVEID